MRIKEKGLAFLAGVTVGAALVLLVEGRGKGLGARARELGKKAGRRITDVVTGDDVLEKRVRTALGRVVAKPGQIDVTADHGEVTLTGYVGEDDARALGPVVSGVRGVKNVVDRTEVEEEAIG